MGPFRPGHSGMAAISENHLPTAPISPIWKRRPRGDRGVDGSNIPELDITPGLRGIGHALQELTLKIRLEVEEVLDQPCGP